MRVQCERYETLSVDFKTPDRNINESGFDLYPKAITGPPRDPVSGAATRTTLAAFLLHTN